MSRLDLLFVVELLLIISSCTCQLVCVEVKAHLPTARGHTAAEWDGSDAIYIMGGLDVSDRPQIRFPDILKYTISTDRIELVQNFTSVISGATTSLGSNGDIYIYGGTSDNDNLLDQVYRYNPTTNDVSIVSNLEYPDIYMSAVKRNHTSDDVFLFGGFNNFVRASTVTQFDMANLTSKVVATFNGSFHSHTVTVVDGEGYAFIFGNSTETGPPKNQGFHSVSKVNLNNFQVSILGEENFPNFYKQPAAIWNGEYVYIIGGYQANSRFSTDSVIKFDPRTMNYEVMNVTGFPFIRGDILSGISAVFVASRNRIYIFGGWSSHPNDDHQIDLTGIWYIDVSEKSEIQSVILAVAGGASGLLVLVGLVFFIKRKYFPTLMNCLRIEGAIQNSESGLAHSEEVQYNTLTSVLQGSSTSYNKLLEIDREDLVFGKRHEFKSIKYVGIAMQKYFAL